MATLNLQVDHNLDDVRHFIRDGAVHFFSTASTLFAAGNSFPDPVVEVYGSVGRFIDVTIGNSDTIDSAILTITCLIAEAGVVVRTNISAEDVDNADRIDDDAEYDALVRTAAVVAWDGLGAWILDVEYPSPEITTVIQEIVDRGGWASGNALNVIWENDGSDLDAWRRGRSHNSDPAKAPKLDIDYTPAAVGDAFGATGEAVGVTHIQQARVVSY